MIIATLGILLTCNNKISSITIFGVMRAYLDVALNENDDMA